MFASQPDSNSLFSGGGFMPSQSTQSADQGQSSAKGRGAQGVFPVTVKQISEASQSNDDRSSLVVDGADVTNVRLVGMVVNKKERVTDVTFSLDDGTGRLDVTRWVNEASDTNEMAVIQNGMYARVCGHLKTFQEKVQVTAFSIRPITNFDEITMHFIECIHAHLSNSKKNLGVGSASGTQQLKSNFYQNGGVGSNPIPVINQPTIGSSVGKSQDINDMVLDIFKEPANLAPEHGIHVDVVAQRLRVPSNKIRTAINYLVNEGVIYSTIDDDHFKST